MEKFDIGAVWREYEVGMVLDGILLKLKWMQ